jgi:transposase
MRSWNGRGWRIDERTLGDRLVLQGILFVLHTGIAWEHLPQELGYGSGMTCRRRLAEWQQASVWQRLHQVLLDRLRAADALDFSRAAVDSSHLRAFKRGRVINRGTRGPVSVCTRGRSPAARFVRLARHAERCA